MLAGGRSNLLFFFFFFETLFPTVKSVCQNKLLVTIVCDGPSVVLESLAFLVLPRVVSAPSNMSQEGFPHNNVKISQVGVTEWPIIR